MAAMRSICVFSGSSSGAREQYTEAARSLGRELALGGVRVVYGGASVGLMAATADGALEAGGEVVGVIPRALIEKEIAHAGLTELRVTESMHERKALMGELSDGFIALPGGYGTLDELAEVLTWSQLGLQAKPCGLLDVAGYFDDLLAFLDHAVEEAFIRTEHRRLVLVETDPARLLETMNAWHPVRRDKWLDDSPGAGLAP
jgi:uncharacterized protein (TIGR00730 family)